MYIWNLQLQTHIMQLGEYYQWYHEFSLVLFLKIKWLDQWCYGG
jgi:hypothetical protein